MRLHEVARYLDDYLRIRDVPDFPGAENGLQLANAGQVTRVAAAVDVCAATIRMAAEQGADLLLVHHGMLWGGPRPVVGPAYDRLTALIRHNIALYSAHLPLDCHREVGNNAVLARRLGVAVRGDFGCERGTAIGVWGDLALERDALAHRLATLLDAAPRLLAFGPARTQRIGIVTGAGGSLIAEAATAGLDTYVTGEGSHHTYFDAEELGLNVYYAGHYATETLGVQALAEHLSATFGLPWTFLHHPTGM